MVVPELLAATQAALARAGATILMAYEFRGDLFDDMAYFDAVNERFDCATTPLRPYEEDQAEHSALYSALHSVLHSALHSVVSIPRCGRTRRTRPASLCDQPATPCGRPATLCDQPATLCGRPVYTYAYVCQAYDDDDEGGCRFLYSYFPYPTATATAEATAEAGAEAVAAAEAEAEVARLVARGFEADEVLAVPLPVFSDSDSDGGDGGDGGDGDGVGASNTAATGGAGCMGGAGGGGRSAALPSGVAGARVGEVLQGIADGGREGVSPKVSLHRPAPPCNALHQPCTTPLRPATPRTNHALPRTAPAPPRTAPHRTAPPCTPTRAARDTMIIRPASPRS